MKDFSMKKNKNLLINFLKEEISSILNDELEYSEDVDTEETSDSLNKKLDDIIEIVKVNRSPSSLNIFLKNIANNISNEDGLDSTATDIQLKMASILICYYLLVVTTDYQIDTSEFNRIKNIMMQKLEESHLEELAEILEKKY